MARASDTVLPIPCPCCGSAGHAVFGQNVVAGRLRWYRSVACPAGCNIEENGDDEAPAELRDALLSARGTWSIRISSLEKMRVRLVLKRALGLSIDALSARLGSYPVLSVGTKAEAEWLTQLLAREGIAAEEWGVRYCLEALLPAQIPDIETARALLAEHKIDPEQVKQVSHNYDGGMQVVMGPDDAMSALIIEHCSADETRPLAGAFMALGIVVEHVLEDRSVAEVDNNK